MTLYSKHILSYLELIEGDNNLNIFKILSDFEKSAFVPVMSSVLP